MTQHRGRVYSQGTPEARTFVEILKAGESLPLQAMTPAAQEALLAVENTALQKNDKALLSFLQTERHRLEWGAEWGPYQREETQAKEIVTDRDSLFLPTYFCILMIVIVAAVFISWVVFISFHDVPEEIQWSRDNIVSGVQGFGPETSTHPEIPESGSLRCAPTEAFEACHRDALALNVPVLLSEGVWRFRKDTISYVPVIVLPGTTIAISSGTTLTLPVCPVAGDYQIFQGLGTIDILDCAEIKPVWFGASPLTVRGNLLRVPR